MIKAKVWFEPPTGAIVEEELEFEDGTTIEEIEDAAMDWIHNQYSSGWEVVIE